MTAETLLEACIMLHRAKMEATWVAVLLILSLEPDKMPNMTALARRMRVTRTAITSAGDHLVMNGFATRVNCETDRRIRYFLITEAGKAKLEELLKP